MHPDAGNQSYRAFRAESARSAASALAAASGYLIGGLTMPLGAQIAHDLVGSDNAFVNGVAIALFVVAAGVLAEPGKRLTPRAAITVGGVLSQ
jgi:hypothetical protein